MQDGQRDVPLSEAEAVICPLGKKGAGGHGLRLSVDAEYTGEKEGTPSARESFLFCAVRKTIFTQ